jgi:hypothetical protein
MKRVLTLVLVALSLVAQAQVITPAPSPAATASTVVGLTDVKVEYSRPKMKGRKIFGDGDTFVVPYNHMWRTGANNGCIVTFSDDIKVGGTDVPKGSYLVFITPTATDWTVVFTKDLTLGGNDPQGYAQTNDAARVMVKPMKTASMVEALTIQITDLAADSKSANIEVAWENTAVKIPLTVDFEKKVMASIESSTKVSPGNLYAAASYYLENGKDLKVALEWITTAAAARPEAFWIWHTKAKIQKALGDKKGATDSAMASKAEAQKQKNDDFIKMNDELLKALK